jgi:hypothetical protein
MRFFLSGISFLDTIAVSFMSPVVHVGSHERALEGKRKREHEPHDFEVTIQNNHFKRV